MSEELQNILCPSCKEKINLELSEKGMLETNDLLKISFRTPTITVQRKMRNVLTYVSVIVCNHCKEIIGTS